ncbi:hypothetical protein O3G_MSEX000660 [Manduca sexta]|nr:hypothetical protein O3G_MSEX000660 [Manduca sexta]
MSGTTRHDPEAYKNPGFWCKTTFIQLGYGIWVNLSAMGIGLAFGFPAVMVPQLFRPDSDIHPSLIEESWIGWFFLWQLIVNFLV